MDPEARGLLVDRITKQAEVALDDLSDLAEKFSGASLERVVLEDGRRFVLKHLPAEGDWLTRATAGSGRVFLLWTSGVLDRAGSVVDHTMIDCVETPSGWTVVMRDASAELLPPHSPVSPAIARLLLEGISRLHGLEPEEPEDGLCSVADRYALFAPEFHRRDAGAPSAHPMRSAIVDGWDNFRELVEEDIARAVESVHDDPGRLGHALDEFPRRLLHGDAKLENLGLRGDRLVTIDWGDLTGYGPVEVDVAWFVLKGAARIDADIADLFDAYPRRTDPRALDLACVGSLAQMGFRMANSIVHGRPESREVGRAHLDWWTQRVRPVLDSLPY